MRRVRHNTYVQADMPLSEAAEVARRQRAAGLLAGLYQQFGRAITVDEAFDAYMHAEERPPSQRITGQEYSAVLGEYIDQMH